MTSRWILQLTTLAELVFKMGIFKELFANFGHFILHTNEYGIFCTPPHWR